MTTPDDAPVRRGPVTKDALSETERYRYTCPRGHTRWVYRPGADRYYCLECRSGFPVDALVDRKHEPLPRATGGDRDGS